ncbi:hypothetical protein DLAC_07559 [Tieghemostelium lacteum]|uniref:MICOS complex subunit n=1 Tax=Tieghemostelium lacteum TaxID=361077 RepID=A0A151ZCT9_TIELA|nr:hypothetical protein DLAC_07559 [Tieghemostelium lacteum]|eukprot:KYQ91768.1 hypothetical protein DLAC_07559 [Tieghemostelium lacteum]
MSGNNSNDYNSASLTATESKPATGHELNKYIDEIMSKMPKVFDNDDTKNLYEREDETIWTPLARRLISFKNHSTEIAPKVCENVDKSFTTVSKSLVEAVDVVELRENYRKGKEMVKKTPPAAIVATATILPILFLFKTPTTLSKLKYPILATIGFGVSSHYYYPELMSEVSKKTIDLYKKYASPSSSNTSQ